MAGTETDRTVEGRRGKVVVRVWEAAQPSRIVVLAHGYGEHSGRYGHVAERLVRDGAVVYAPDHLGHGRSEGERVLVEDADDIVADVHEVVRLAAGEHPGLPVVMIGHSMGGIVATRYAQQHADELAGLVLSGPVVGGNPAFAALAAMDPIPDVPIDPSVLSRDPAVGEAYAADPLVWHGPFKRPTLQAMLAAVDTIAAGPGFGALPVLHLHGEQDQLAPLDATRPALDRLRGDDHTETIYPGAQHEIFNETNRDEILDDLAGFVARVTTARS